MTFTDEEIELIKEIVCDWGSDCPGADYDKVKELSYKLGLETRPTPEEIEAQEKHNKEWAESDAGKQIVQLMTLSNRYLISMAEEIVKPTMVRVSNDYWNGKNNDE